MKSAVDSAAASLALSGPSTAASPPKRSVRSLEDVARPEEACVTLKGIERVVHAEVLVAGTPAARESRRDLPCHELPQGSTTPGPRREDRQVLLAGGDRTLVLAYSESDRVSLGVSFYYMANACGRLLGTLLSGVLYHLQA